MYDFTLIMKLNYKPLILAGLILGMSLLTPACKKDEKKDDDVKVFSGTFNTGAPAYAFVGEELTMYCGGLSKENGDTLVGYTWKISVDDVVDTVRSESDPATRPAVKHYVVPDTLGTFRITVSAFASGYSSSSAYSDIVFLKDTMDGRGSITGIVIDPHADFYQSDPRDGTSYLCRKTGDKVWMRQNLAFEGSKESILGVPYNNEPRLSKTFGRYYTWEEAVQVCPPDWRLPSEKELAELASAVLPDAAEHCNFKDIAGDFMADARFNGERMWGYWPHDVTITDRLGFSALPCGTVQVTGSVNTFTHFGDYAAFWTSDKIEDAPEAVFRYVNSKSRDVFVETGSTTKLRLNVRCVRDRKEGE